MDFPLRRAWTLVRGAMPYAVHRAAVYGVLCLGLFCYLWMLAIVGGVFGAIAFWTLFIGSAGIALLIGMGGFVSVYLLYRRRIGHVAILTELATEGRLPGGISQVKWAEGRVLHYFGGLAGLLDVRRIIRETMRSLDRNLFDSSAVLPVPGLEGGSRFAWHVADLSVGYIEEAFAAYAFHTRNDNIYESIRAAILIYCQCWKTMLSRAITLTWLGYAFGLSVAVVCLIPLGMLAWSTPPSWAVAHFALFATGLLIGYFAKSAVFDPCASAAMAVTFLDEAEILAPDAEWERKVEAACPAYAELKEKVRPAKRARSRKTAKETGA